MKMTQNTILITGGGSGIGRGLAEAFHALGNQVIIAGRSTQKLEETTAANPGMKSFPLDITDAESIQSFATEVAAAYPDLNVLINMAGIMKSEKLKNQTFPLTAVEDTITTNLLGPIRLTAALLPALLARPDAVIMNVTSGLAFVPLSLTPTYCATKAALHSYTESLRYQLKDTAVQVMELIPPYVRTGLAGERQANDPAAMPLEEYIAETMHLLTTHPDANEICVERVKPLRFAAQSGHYDEFYMKFNDAMATTRAGE